MMNKATKQIKEQLDTIHPRIPDAYTALNEGRISRREFIRFATLLGCSAAFASSCSIIENRDNLILTENPSEIVQAASITRGGTLTLGFEFQEIGHPATLEWPEVSNIVRQVAEYLTMTDENNVTKPYLLERWETNRSVTEWRLYLRKGIKFNNGDELTADDLIFNFSQWLDPNLGSSMLGLLSYLKGMESVEKVDDYSIRLKLSSPNIGVPEHLFHYPAAIMHRSFAGDFVRQPIGTGPFNLAEFTADQQIVLTRREGYWQNGGDGLPLPYLDQVVYLPMSKDAAIEAIQIGKIDSFYNPRPQDWQFLKEKPDLEIQSASTAQTLVLRVRVDQGPPWDDVRVRQALRKIQNREKIMAVAYFGQGDYGTDAHIAPVHPAYHPRELAEYDPVGAKALLEEWAADTGNSLPIKATIVSKNDEGEKEYAQVLQEDAEGTGFEFNLDITDPSGYWARWDQVAVGITAWTHRPLDTMVLPLSYIGDVNGNPVPWNETRWVDPEFSSILKEAEATLDVTERREKVGRLMDIFEDRGPVGIAFFKSVWRIHHKRVHNLPGHPTSYDLLLNTWVEPREI